MSSRIKDAETRFHCVQLVTAKDQVFPAVGAFGRRGENWLRLVVEQAGLTNSMQVQGRLKDQAAWTDVGSPVVGLGAGVTIDIKDYDEYRFKCLAFNPIDDTPEVQHIAFDAVPDAGVYKLQYGATKTANIAFDANAAAVQAALRLIAGLEGVTVAGDYTAGFDVTFEGVHGNATLLLCPGADKTITASAVAVVVTITTTTPGVAGVTPVKLIASGFYL